MDFDLIIENGMVATMNRRREILPAGWLGVRDGRIIAIEPMPPPSPSPPSLKMPGAADAPAHAPPGRPPAKTTHALPGRPQAKTVIDAAGCIVMPGLINAHTHLPMTLFRGLADDLPLMTWLNDHIFPAERAHINPETVRAGALLACAEMILSGTTTCCDGYFHEDGVAEAITAAGLRGVAGQGVIDFPAPGVPDPRRNLDHARAFLSGAGFSDRLAPSIFCHSPYACGPDTLKKAKAMAGDRLFQIHVAETRDEYDRIRGTHGKSPVAYLDSLGILDENTLLVHAVWLDPEDVEIMALRRVKVAHCPESNMKLASGVCPAPDLMAAGIPVGLGTDGCASGNTLDMFRVMDRAAKLHKVVRHDPTLMDADVVLEMATRRGAEALGMGNRTGSLSVGKAADVIVVEMAPPHLTPLYHPASHLVYCAGGGDVRDVVVDGRILLLNRRLQTLDIQGIMEKVRLIADGISTNSGGRGGQAGGAGPVNV